MSWPSGVVVVVISLIKAKKRKEKKNRDRELGDMRRLFWGKTGRKEARAQKK